MREGIITTGHIPGQAVLKSDLEAALPAVRARFLAEYRQRRRLGATPYAALQEIRGCSGSWWASQVLAGMDPDIMELALCVTAARAIDSRIGKPVYWWIP